MRKGRLHRPVHESIAPPMQLLISMLATSTDPGERIILQAKLHEVLTYSQIRKLWVVSKPNASH